MRLRRWSALLALATWPVSALADSDGQVWYQLYAIPKITERWRGHMELQARYGQDMTTLSRLLIRPAIGYAWPSGLSTWLGYLWQGSYPHLMVENRLWEQLQYDWKLDDVWWLQGRFRAEQRWTPAVSGSLRLRFLARGLRQISGNIYAVASAELFETVTNPLPGSQGGFDQARLFAGFNVKVASEVRVETGYMYNPVNKSGATPDTINHNLILALFWNPDFS